MFALDAGWSSLAARRAHNPKVVGSNPAPATKFLVIDPILGSFCFLVVIINYAFAAKVANDS
jgi:ribosome maturation factor RimP